MDIGADPRSDALLRDFLGKGPLVSRTHGPAVAPGEEGAGPKHRSVGQVLRSAVLAGMAVAAMVHAVAPAAASAMEAGVPGRAVYVQAVEASPPATPEEASRVLFAADSASWSMPALYRSLPQLKEDWSSASGRHAVRIADMRVRSPEYGATGVGGWAVEGVERTQSGPAWKHIGSSAAADRGDETAACMVTISDGAFEAASSHFVRTMTASLESRGIRGDKATDAFWTMIADHEIGHCSHRDGMYSGMDSVQYGSSASTSLNEMMADSWMMAMDYARHGGDTRRSEAWMDGRMMDLVRSGLYRNDQHLARGEGVEEAMAGRITSSAAADYATPVVRQPVLDFLRGRTPEEIGAMARSMEPDHDGTMRNALGMAISKVVRQAWEIFVYGPDMDDDLAFMKTVADLAEGMAEAMTVEGVLVLGPTTPAFFREGIADAMARTGWTPTYEVAPDLGRTIPKWEDVPGLIEAALQGQGPAVGYQLLETQPVSLTMSASPR